MFQFSRLSGLPGGAALGNPTSDHLLGVFNAVEGVSDGTLDAQDVRAIAEALWLPRVWPFRQIIDQLSR